MSPVSFSRSGKLHWKIVLAALLLLLVTTQALAAPSCKKVKGKFTLEALIGPQCLSPIGLCATGTYTGSLAGSSVFTGTSMITSADTPTTGVIFVTGDTTLNTDSGALLIKHAISMATFGAEEFAQVDTLIGGTGAWAGSTGTITATGTMSSAGGSGTYSGEICTP